MAQRADVYSLSAANKIVKKLGHKMQTYPKTFFTTNGITVSMRYFVPCRKLQKYTSEETQEIHRMIMKSVEFAYPHGVIVGGLK